MNNLLLNKYQPVYIEDFNYDNDYCEYIKSISNNTDLNILLLGYVGSGKTVFLNAILYNYYKVNSLNSIKNNILYISSLKEQGVSFYKNDVKNFCQSTSEIYGKKKSIIIDNLDTMSEINQNIFKMHMDKYGKRVNFLCSCTNINKINSVILNHFVVINIKPINKDVLNYVFNKIVECEKLIISDKLRENFIKYSNNSIKLLINNLEKYKLLNDKIDFTDKNINNNILIKELQDYYNYCLNRDKENAHKKLIEIYEDGYSIIDIVEYMYINLKFNDFIANDIKYTILKILSKYLLSVNNTNEDELIIYFITNDIINII